MPNSKGRGWRKNHAAETDDLITFIADHPGCTTMDMQQRFDVGHSHVTRKLKGTRERIRVDKRNLPYRYYLINKRPPPPPLKPGNWLATIPWTGDITEAMAGRNL